MKVLVVDDQTYNRDLLNFILEDEGYTSVEAENGAVAVEVFQQHKDIDLVLMDVNMPVMGGIEATRMIKQDVSRFVPVIFITALDDTEMLTSCLEAGGDDFLAKPVNDAALIAKMKAHGRTQSLYKKLQSANDTLEYHARLMEREHTIVEHVFKRGSDRIKTTCDNLQMYTSPMSMFNGDVLLQAPSPSGGVYFLLGDFTGHGLAASIGTLPVSEIFHTFTARQASISQMVREINQRLFELLPTNMFFCACIGFLDKSGEQLTVWSGGMNDILKISPDSRQIERIMAEHMPLGILNDDEFEDESSLVPVSQGDRLYTYTDGINEATNAEGEEFGLARLESIICQHTDNLVQIITDEVHDFQGQGQQSDDVSLIELTTEPVVHRDKKTGEVVDVGLKYHAAESFPWDMHMHLSGDDLKKTSIVDQVMGFVGSIQGIELHQDKIFTIVSELYSNALEHGVLHLDSALKSTADGFEEYYRLREERLNKLNDDFIQLDFRYLSGSPNAVELLITDSGDGFDFVEMQRKIEDDEQSHRRGLDLLKSLCAVLDYSNSGRTVRAQYHLSI